MMTPDKMPNHALLSHGIDATQRHVVVCGGGVIGCCIAYFLALRGVSVTVVERHKVACAASGKAGGFLALDWCDGSPLEQLARRSFDLHHKLALDLDGAVNYGYRKLTTLSIQTDATTKKRNKMALPEELPPWVNAELVKRASVIGTEETTAQVHPEKFTETIMNAALKLGAKLKIGVVEDLVHEQGAVTGVRVDGEILAATSVVLALGPWSPIVRKWLPSFPLITSEKYHSAVFQHELSGHALFVEHTMQKNKMVSPEVYPRPDGTVYVCGEKRGIELPDNPEDVTPVEDAIRAICDVAISVAPGLTRQKLIVQQSCYLPLSPDGTPLIGKWPKIESIYIATGHSCWGILNAPATGEALSQLIIDEHSGIDLSPFDPKRFC